MLQAHELQIAEEKEDDERRKCIPKDQVFDFRSRSSCISTCDIKHLSRFEGKSKQI